MPNVKVGGSWVDAEPRVKVSGSWHNVDKSWVKVGGIWQPEFLPFAAVTHDGSLSSDDTYYYIDFAANLLPTTSPTSHNYTFTITGKPLAVDYLIVGQGGNGNDGVYRSIRVFPPSYPPYYMYPYGGFSGGGGGVLSGSTTLGIGSHPISLYNRAYTDITNPRGGDTTAFGLTALGGGRGGYWGGAPAYGTYAAEQAGQNGGSGGAGADSTQVGLGTAGQGSDASYISTLDHFTGSYKLRLAPFRFTGKATYGYANGGGAGGPGGPGAGLYSPWASLSDATAEEQAVFAFPSSKEADIGPPVTVLGLTVSNGGHIGYQNYSNYGAGGQGANGLTAADSPGGRGGIVRIRFLKSDVGG